MNKYLQDQDYDVTIPTIVPIAAVLGLLVMVSCSVMVFG